MAKEMGHKVIRLPPYHCQYNAIELIWAHVKGHVTKHNTKPPFTANKMLTLLQDACEHVTAEDWKKVINKSRKIMENDWERDVHFDNIHDQELIINLQDCFSDSESDYGDIIFMIRGAYYIILESRASRRVDEGPQFVSQDCGLLLYFGLYEFYKKELNIKCHSGPCENNNKIL